MPSAANLPTGPDRHLRTDSLGADLGRQTVLQGTLTLVGQGLTLLVTIVSTMILARLATPADYGIVGMALTFVAFVGVFNDFGVPMATVQRAELSQEQASTLFWIGLGLNVLIALLCLAVAPGLAKFYFEPRLVAIFVPMATVPVLVGLGNFHMALLKRQLRFGALAVNEVAALAAGCLVAIVMAWRGAGYWALVAQYPVTAGVRSLMLWSACGWRPSRPGRLAEVRSMLSFGRDLTLYRIVNHLGKHIDRVLIGRMAGEVALGLYSAADRWATFPILQVYPRLTSVAVSGLSRVRHDEKRYRDYQQRALEPLLAVLLPALALAFAASRDVILVLMGPQWLHAAPLLQILLVGAFATSISQFTKWVYLVEGRTSLQLRWGLVTSTATAIAVMVGAVWGATGVAIAFSASCCVLALPSVAVCLRDSPIRLTDVAHATWRPASASGIAAAAVMIFRPALPESALIGLAASTVGFGLVFLASWLAMPGGVGALKNMSRLAEAFRPAKRPAQVPGDAAARSRAETRAGS